MRAQARSGDADGGGVSVLLDGDDERKDERIVRQVDMVEDVELGEGESILGRFEEAFFGSCSPA